MLRHHRRHRSSKHNARHSAQSLHTAVHLFTQSYTHTHTAHLAYPLRGAGHTVVQAVVPADGPPQLGVGAVLLQRVGAFVHEVVVDGRVPHRAIVHVHLPRQVLE